MRATTASVFAALLLAQSTFHDASGRVIGKEHTDANGVTTFSDAAGRTVGKSRTDLNGVTNFYDQAGRVTAKERQNENR